MQKLQKSGSDGTERVLKTIVSLKARCFKVFTSTFVVIILVYIYNHPILLVTAAHPDKHLD